MHIHTHTHKRTNTDSYSTFHNLRLPDSNDSVQQHHRHQSAREVPSHYGLNLLRRNFPAVAVITTVLTVARGRRWIIEVLELRRRDLKQ